MPGELCAWYCGGGDFRHSQTAPKCSLVAGGWRGYHRSSQPSATAIHSQPTQISWILPQLRPAHGRGCQLHQPRGKWIAHSAFSRRGGRGMEQTVRCGDLQNCPGVKNRSLWVRGWRDTKAGLFSAASVSQDRCHQSHSFSDSATLVFYFNPWFLESGQYAHILIWGLGYLGGGGSYCFNF